MGKALKPIIDLLKSSRVEMKLKDIVSRTNDAVRWTQVPSNIMNKVMKYDNKVVRVDRGIYKYQNPGKLQLVQKREEQQEQEQATFEAPKPPEYTIPVDNKEDKRLKVGEVVTGVVSKIVSYGAFIDIPDFDTSGLLHVTNIRRGKHLWRIEDIEEYLQVGDVIQVKLITYRQGKVSLSTYDLPLPNHKEETTLGEKLQPLAPEILQTIPEPEPVPPPYQMVFSPASVSKDELEDLYEVIRKRVGVISLTAKDELKAAVKKYGIVKVTMALMAANDFEADVSLAFVKHVETKANGGL